MAVHGKNTAVLVGGHDLTEYLNEASTSKSNDAAEASHFRQSAKEYVVGQADATVSVSGLFSGDVDAAQAVIERVQDGDETPLITVSFGYDVTVGARVRMGRVKSTSLEVSSPIGDVVSISGEFQCDGGLRGGRFLSGIAEADVVLALPGVDFGAAAVRAFEVFAHVLSNPRTTDSTVTIQDSTDGTVWIDVDTATIPAATSGHYALPLPAGTERFLRARVSPGAGTGPLVLVIAASR